MVNISTKCSSSTRRTWTLLLATICVAASLAATGCAPDKAIRGNLPRPEKLDQVKVGLSTRNDVRELLGPPSNVGTFNDKVWYYISQTTEDVPMGLPEVLDRKIITIQFNDTGLVEDIKTLDKTAGRNVSPVERTTPAAGHEPSLLRDLFGNIGKVSPNAPGSSQ